MVTLAYKLACIAVAIAGVIIAFPLATYAGIMGIANLSSGGLLILLPETASFVVIVWAIGRTVLRLRSAVASTLVAPTIAGLLGVVSIWIGLPFSQHPPGA